jgi:hypothetical protein
MMLHTPQSIKFKVPFYGVSNTKGIFHIHCVEHISKTHMLGAPFFQVQHVDMPKAHPKPSIRFKCSTLGQNMDVLMRSKTLAHSEMFFYRDKNAILRLEFKVEPLDGGKSHDLEITFSFWNALVYMAVPFFPMFVLINTLEDFHFMKNDAYVDEHPLFALYRLYIFSNHVFTKHAKEFKYNKASQVIGEVQDL